MQRKEFLVTGLMAGIAVTGLGKSLSNTSEKPSLKPFYLPPMEHPLITKAMLPSA